MVGVAGRSKACHTCRQRRIRCGAEKPSCSNCLKSGRPCAGYHKAQVFIPSRYAKITNTGGITLDAPLSLSQCKSNKHNSYGHQAFQGLGQGHASQLAKSAWMEGPWISKSKTMHDLLVDIFLQVPGLLSEVRAATSLQPRQSSLTAGLKTLSALLTLNSQLNEWFESYQYTYPTLYWPQLSVASSSTDNEELGKLYPVSFHFPSYHVAETMILYWTVQTLIHASICSLSSRLPSSETKDITTFEGDNLSAKDNDDMSLADIQHIVETSDFMLWPETSARYICQSVEYFFQQEFRGIGAGVVLSPILVVKACLSRSARDFSREIAWIDETIGRIQYNGAGLAACV
ncbi:hypothetical protein FOC1_g10006531 [Fusarium oxysporum f. sp. cubense race 1]|uniref:Zn(2)-C6 fungal-type domain-containing protein n=1 Tax=Fusarium oxysporum f. sp. cubense (strain race 1) TaxID=1229664 RepID=N4U8J3_FUSC1|nr:hypothetical protein FOC1_g10006531 [Fusarium oxysporum f. sp. cubense race 1]